MKRCTFIFGWIFCFSCVTESILMSETLRKMISLGISRKSISNNFLAWLWVKLCNLDVFSQGKKLGGIGAPKNMILFASGGPKLHQMTIPKYLHGTEICTYMYITGWWFQIFFIFIPTWGEDPIGRGFEDLGGVLSPCPKRTKCVPLRWWHS